MDKKSLVIGTRGSALALYQANLVKAKLEDIYPTCSIELKIIQTTGDKRTDVPLSEVAQVSGVVDKGVFIKELEIALERGDIDVAVHSLKDVPSLLEPQFSLSAVLSRASVEDVLITKDPNWDGTGTLATGSLRRKLMARSYWGKELQFADLRGNVPTRLEKLVNNDDWDAIILAKAGLERLGLYSPTAMVKSISVWMKELPVTDFVPAVGQGIIGLETRREDELTQSMIQPINDAFSFACAVAERTFLAKLGATCSTPVGVYANNGNSDDTMVLRVKYYRDNHDEPILFDVEGSPLEPELLGEKAWLNLAQI